MKGIQCSLYYLYQSAGATTTKYHRMSGFTEILPILEAGGMRSGCQPGRVLARALSCWLADGSLPAGSSHGRERVSVSLPLLVRALIPL